MFNCLVVCFSDAGSLLLEITSGQVDYSCTYWRFFLSRLPYNLPIHWQYFLLQAWIFDGTFCRFRRCASHSLNKPPVCFFVRSSRTFLVLVLVGFHRFPSCPASSCRLCRISTTIFSLFSLYYSFFSYYFIRLGDDSTNYFILYHYLKSIECSTIILVTKLLPKYKNT